MRILLWLWLLLAPGALAQRIAVIGDWGAESPHRALVAEAMRKSHELKPFAALFTLGDNFYPRGEPIPKFYDELPKVRTYPAFGNHDVPAIAKQLKLFGVDRTYYSVRLEQIEVFVLYSEEFTPQQRQWLEAALAASKAPWKVVILHRPLYSSGVHGGNRSLRVALEPLLRQYRVPLVLAGHEHDYERLEARGMVHIVAGGGGAYLRDFLIVQAESKVRRVSPNYLILEASLEQLVVTAYNEKNEVIDRVELSR